MIVFEPVLRARADEKRDTQIPGLSNSP